jgi:predicted RNA-binding protein (virulence factor B family)
MGQRELLGRIVRLKVLRSTPSGAILENEILLPKSQVPKDATEVEVFVHLDSDDKPIATVNMPKIVLGEVSFLEVVDLASFGAFVDWGLPKQLLVPKAEQTRDLRVGERHPIALYVDDTGRLAGTMRISERLDHVGEFSVDEWVEGEAWRKEPGLGVFVIVEKAFLGLLPESEPHTLKRGDSARFRVARVHRDGKIELSLRGAAHEEIEKDGQAILDALQRPRPPRLSDHSSPEEIRAAFGLSKKAFKRAVGGLLKRGAVRLEEDGVVVVAKA